MQEAIDGVRDRCKYRIRIYDDNFDVIKLEIKYKKDSNVVVVVSAATLPYGSSVKIASKIASEIWSQILSGCPSVTDSDVNNLLIIFLPFIFILIDTKKTSLSEREV